MIPTPGSADGKMTKGRIFGGGVSSRAPSLPLLSEKMQTVLPAARAAAGGHGVFSSPASVALCITFKCSPFRLLIKNDPALLIAY